jgi:hypothetical protein
VNIGRTISLEILSEYKEVTFYTLKYTDEEFSETEKFLMNFMDDDNFTEDIGIITKMIEKIGNSGAEQRHFRNAGKVKDSVGELPEHLYSSKLRLYAIHTSKDIVILGNGGHKTTRTYNEDPHLDKCVSILQTIDNELKKCLRNKTTLINNRKLVGITNFNVL